MQATCTIECHLTSPLTAFFYVSGASCKRRKWYTNANSSLPCSMDICRSPSDTSSSRICSARRCLETPLACIPYYILALRAQAWQAQGVAEGILTNHQVHKHGPPMPTSPCSTIVPGARCTGERLPLADLMAGDNAASGKAGAARDMFKG